MATMPPFTTTRKAPRRIPDTRINPDGVLLRRFEREGADKIATALDKLRRETFRGITADTVHQLTTRTQDQEITKTLTDTLTALLREWAQAGANFGREQVERIIFGTKQVGGVAIDWQLANNAAADWAVEYGRTLSGLLLKTTNERIQKEVAAFIRGEGELKDLIERVRGGHLYSFSRAQTIAVTEVTRAYAQGNMAAWRESGVTQGKEWSTAEDELVCPLCGPLADVVVDLDADFPNGGGSGPPRHTRCRCWVVPVPIGDV